MTVTSMTPLMQIEKTIISKARSLVVFGEGIPTSKLWIVGEALGADEEAQGRPFVGQTGQLLNLLLKSANLSRAQAYITNVVPVRPPGNKLERLEETGLTLDLCKDRLRMAIELFRPNCILALGNTALEALVGEDGITEWRGSILTSTITDVVRVKVVPSIHPASILYMADETAKHEREYKGGRKYTYGAAKLTLAFDIARAAEEAQTSNLPPFDWQFNLAPTQADLDQFFNDKTIWCRERDITFDIETTKDYKIDSIAFGLDARTAICISRDMIESAFGQRILTAIFRFKRKCQLVTQNGQFDLTILHKNGIITIDNPDIIAFDTMIAHHWLWPELPHDLHYLTSIYTKIPYYKFMRTSEDRMERALYNCLDAVATWQVAQELRKETYELFEQQQ